MVKQHPCRLLVPTFCCLTTVITVYLDYIERKIIIVLSLVVCTKCSGVFPSSSFSPTLAPYVLHVIYGTWHPAQLHIIYGTLAGWPCIFFVTKGTLLFFLAPCIFNQFEKHILLTMMMVKKMNDYLNHCIGWNDIMNMWDESCKEVWAPGREAFAQSEVYCVGLQGVALSSPCNNNVILDQIFSFSKYPIYMDIINFKRRKHCPAIVIMISDQLPCFQERFQSMQCNVPLLVHWHTVANQTHLLSLTPCPAPPRLTRLNAEESLWLAMSRPCMVT